MERESQIQAWGLGWHTRLWSAPLIAFQSQDEAAWLDTITKLRHRLWLAAVMVTKGPPVSERGCLAGTTGREGMHRVSVPGLAV